MIEIEFGEEIAELPGVFADRRTGIWSAVGGGIECRAAKEVLFDKFEVGVVTQHLMINKTAACVRADQQSGDAQPVTVDIDNRGYHMVIETAPVIPR